MAKPKKLSVKTLLKDTYLAMIKNACGSVIWSNYYALVNGKKKISFIMVRHLVLSLQLQSLRFLI